MATSIRLTGISLLVAILAGVSFLLKGKRTIITYNFELNFKVGRFNLPLPPLPSNELTNQALPPQQVQTQPWDQTKHSKEEKKQRKQKRKATKSNAEVKRKKRRTVTQEELAELAADVALMKKLKKRKITEEQFDKAFEVEGE